MDNISLVSRYFLYALSFGSGAFSFLVSTKHTGVGFFKLITSVAFASLLIFLGLEYSEIKQFNNPVIYLSLVLLFFKAIQYVQHKDQKSKYMWFLFAIEHITYLALGYYFAATQMQAYLFLTLSAMYLGVVNYSMLLGHYYLVVPKLSEKPLLYATQIFWVILIIKLILSTLNTFDHWEFFIEGTEKGQGYVFNWIIVLMRWLWGYVAVFVLSIFNWKLCKIRSIQSATGVLYVMVFFTLIGELISAYLFLTYGLFI